MMWKEMKWMGGLASLSAVALISACAPHDYRIASWPPALDQVNQQYQPGDPEHYWANLIASLPHEGEGMRGEPFSESDKQAVLDEWMEVRDTWFAHVPDGFSRSDITAYHRNAVNNVQASDYWHLNDPPMNASGFVSNGIHRQDDAERDTTWVQVDIPVASADEGYELVEAISHYVDDILSGDGGWTRQFGPNRYAQYQGELNQAESLAARFEGSDTTEARDWRRRAEVLGRLVDQPLESVDFLYASTRGFAMIMVSNEAEAVDNRYNYAVGRIVRPQQPFVRVELLYGEVI